MTEIKDIGDLTADERRALVPDNKFEEDKIAHLSTLPAAHIIPLIPNLLGWTEDMHWPIAFPICTLLITKVPEASLNPIRQILFPGEIHADGFHVHGEDPDWQWNVLCYIVGKMAREYQAMMREDLVRFRAKITREMQADYDFEELLDGLLTRLRVGENQST